MMLAQGCLHDAGAITVRHARERHSIYPGVVKALEFVRDRSRDGDHPPHRHLELVGE